MSLVIRLRKPGKPIKRRYHYKIVVDEKRSKKDGKFVEEIGYWDPSKTPKLLKLDFERYKHWIHIGAQPTETVKGLAKKAKENEGQNFVVEEKPRKKKKTATPDQTAKPEEQVKEEAKEQKALQEQEPEQQKPDSE